MAEAASGYAWRTAETLVEPGFEAHQWIGNGCVTGSGQRLMVVYAPRTFTNDAMFPQRGGVYRDGGSGVGGGDQAGRADQPGVRDRSES